MLQLLDGLRQACPLCVRSFSSVEVYHAVYPPFFCIELGHLRLVISQSKLVSENSTITSRLLAAPIGSGALRQAVPSDRDRNGSGARRAGHREADVVVAVVIRTPPTLTSGILTAQLTFMKEVKGAGRALFQVGGPRRVPAVRPLYPSRWCPHTTCSTFPFALRTDFLVITGSQIRSANASVYDRTHCRLEFGRSLHQPTKS